MESIHELAKEIMKHYKGQGVIGKDVEDFSGVNIALGVSNFENSVVSASFTF